VRRGEGRRRVRGDVPICGLTSRWKAVAEHGADFMRTVGFVDDARSMGLVTRYKGLPLDAWLWLLRLPNRA
jgi:hypothetical protein